MGCARISVLVILITSFSFATCDAPASTRLNSAAFRKDDDEHRVGCFVIDNNFCKGSERLLGTTHPDILYGKEECRYAVLGTISAYLASLSKKTADPLSGAKLADDGTHEMYTITHTDTLDNTQVHTRFRIRMQPFLVNVETEIKDSDGGSILIDFCDDEGLNAANAYAITELYKGVIGACYEALKEPDCFGASYTNPDFDWLYKN